MGFTLKNENIMMNTKMLSIERDHSKRYAEIYEMASSFPLPPSFSIQIKPQKATESSTQKTV
jgi:hypothetical protein